MDCTSLKEWATLAGNVGFPMLVAAYLLVRIERAMHHLTLTLHQLVQLVSNLEHGE